MNVNVIGRINNINLSPKHGMMAIYEAIINSIHSTEQVASKRKTYIRVRFNRDTSEIEIPDGSGIYSAPIVDVSIADNGVGFNEVNYEAFQTSDTTVKQHIGGKGIGRFLWLKVFDSVEIESTFAENGTMMRRSFDFSLAENGISYHKKSAAKDHEFITEVKLKNIRQEYSQYMPKKLDTLAFKILEHLLAYFIIGSPPQIVIEDVFSGQQIGLLDLYQKEILQNKTMMSLAIGEHEFLLHFVKLYSSMETIHRIYYCAHGREVKSEELRNLLPILGSKIRGVNDDFVAMFYLSGNYLDHYVNQERVGFYIDTSGGNEDLFDGTLLSFEEIRQAIIPVIREELDEWIQPLRKHHIERLQHFVEQENPEYRNVLKYKSDKLEYIAPNLPDQKLELKLHELNQEIEMDIKKESQKFAEDDTEYTEEFIQKVSDFGMAKLAEYIIHRRDVLQLLEKRLQQKRSGKYELEQSVHELIFPLRMSSDDVDYNRQNLWIIDEKLAYHYFLASDVPLTSNPITDSTSLMRPDLAIFNAPFAFVEDEIPYTSVVIIEFKRPVRDDYTDSDNPVNQIQNYIREIQNGNTFDRNGRPFKVGKSIPFYGYIICDITPKIQQFAENGFLTNTPDMQGYFGFNPNLNCYIEIISFDKLIADARKRNRILFDKLGLSTTRSYIHISE